ncbi:RCC1 and BTB domain-containing protein 1-like isoform X1 [Apis laboriosa]|uniref:RCC1 and BTB domain-containing protein 1-like isoform X1 n=1 Tax=Apis laboriosa TaxID=183418 RepID=UPI001CC4AE94|nr:RCC1 and BTB domain-containing protein 1-like isoform X1 [Apis laboriosa]
MYSCDLTKWSIFSLLEPKFISNIHMAVVYGNIGNEALIVTKDKMVYAVGNNTCGCLGTGDTQSTLYPKKIEELCGKDIKTFAYGKGPHVLALTEEGKVYSWGQNCHYELGNTFGSQALTPAIITNLCNEFIVDIACGSHHSLALTNDGEVYAWGQNTSGQVGCHDITTLVQDIPRKLNFTLTGKKVICISCGDSFSVVVTNNGEVYSWGRNDVGQLGIENNNNDQFHPCRITSLAKIVIEKVVCGSIHTLALSDEGVLYVWGANNYGQLGLTTVLLNTNIWKPTKLEVPEMRRVLDIATSYYNCISIALCEGNRIFMWGQCLGQNVKVPTLTPLKCLYDVFAFYALPAVMHQPLIFHSDEESNLIDSLREAFDDSTTSDLIIQVHGNPIHVHKAILKIRCHYFRTMFQEHWAENSQSVICHKQFSYDVYKTFLKYLYTNEIDPFLDPLNALELLDLANAYSENQLKRYCIQIINKGITVTNVIVLYNTSIQYNAKELEEYCFKFALNHMTAVVQTADFAKLDESIVKTFIIKAAQAGAFKT